MYLNCNAAVIFGGVCRIVNKLNGIVIENAYADSFRFDAAYADSSAWFSSNQWQFEF